MNRAIGDFRWVDIFRWLHFRHLDYRYIYLKLVFPKTSFFTSSLNSVSVSRIHHRNNRTGIVESQKTITCDSTGPKSIESACDFKPKACGHMCLAIRLQFQFQWSLKFVNSVAQEWHYWHAAVSSRRRCRESVNERARRDAPGVIKAATAVCRLSYSYVHYRIDSAQV